MSPLLYASQKDCTEIAQILIKANADVHAKDFSDAIPLARAIMNNHIKVARILIEADSNLNVQKNSDTYGSFIGSFAENVLGFKKTLLDLAKTDEMRNLLLNKLSSLTK